MNNLAKRFLAIVLSVTLLCSLGAVALADGTSFSDMPSDYSTAALQAAVANGLLKGTDGKILPNDNLTRAQMAAVIVRAFGATKEASLASFTDVDSGAWYYTELSKAVYMKTLNGSANKLMPNDNITREQAFAVVARALNLESGTAADLSAFTDASSVSSWAVGTTAAMVKGGYIHGANGQLNPTANITRKDFAVVMDNIIKQYISKAGTYTEVKDGSVMINVPDVTLKDITVNGNLIIGDGVGDGNVTLENVKVTGTTVVRGGGVHSFIVKGDSSLGKITVAKVDGNVRVAVEGAAKVELVEVKDGKNDVVVEGKIATLEVAGSNVPVKVQNAEIKEVKVSAPQADVTVRSGAKVETVRATAVEPAIKVAEGAIVTNVEATSTATGAKVAVTKGATVETVNAAATGTAITGEGTVKNANVTGNNVKVDTTGTKTTVSSTATGTTSNGSSVPSGTTTTTTGGAVTNYSVAVRISDGTSANDITNSASSLLATTKIADEVWTLVNAKKTDIKQAFVKSASSYTTYLYGLASKAKSAMNNPSDWSTFVNNYSNKTFTVDSYTYTTVVSTALENLNTTVASTGTYTIVVNVKASPEATTDTATYTITITVS
jgi:hypothetical protein